MTENNKNICKNSLTITKKRPEFEYFSYCDRQMNDNRSRFFFSRLEIMILKFFHELRMAGVPWQVFAFFENY